MIVTGDKKLVPGDASTVTHDTPPSYEASVQSSSQVPVITTTPENIPTLQNPPNVPAANFLRIKRTHSSIRGTYVIDASLSIPEMPTSAEVDESSSDLGDSEETKKKNLYLESVHASVSAEVWLVEGDPEVRQEPTAQKAELEVNAVHGSVNLKLYRLTERPFSLIAESKHSSVTVSLPSDFVGPVTLSTEHGSVALSSSMQSRLMTFSEEDGTRKCFIGDYRKAGYTNKEKWTGSTAEIGSKYGRIKLLFVDDPVDTSSPFSANFWNKLFGRT